MTTKKKPNQSKAIELSSREAPIERSMSIQDVIGSVMAIEQLEVLTAATPAHAIKIRPGRGGKSLKYVPHGYVTDRLNKAFGFDWDFKLLPFFEHGSIYHMETVQTGIMPKTKEPIFTRYISVYGELTVRIHNPKKLSEVVATVTKPGPGSSVWYPENEWGDALKAAKSDGLKVAAHELGIALDLYWDDEYERNQYEAEQEKKRQQKQAEQDVINASFVELPPQTGPELVARAYSELGMNGQAIAETLGLPTIADVMKSFKVEYWEVLKNAKAKAENKE